MTAMLLRSSRLAVACSLGLALSAQSRPATGPSTVEDVLPPSTYAAVCSAGLAAHVEAANGSSLAPMVRQLLEQLPPDLRERLLEQELTRVADQVQADLQRDGWRPADLRALLARPMALAVGRLTIEGMGPSVALVVDEGDAGPTLRRVRDLVLRQLPGRNRQQEEVRIGQHSALVSRAPEQPPLFTASIGGFFVATNSRPYLGELADVLAGAPAWTKTSRLGELRAELGDRPLMSAFVDGRQLTGWLQPMLPYETAAYADVLGLGGIDAIYAATTASGDHLHLGLGGSARGLCKAAWSQPVDLSFVGACSPNTVLLAAGSLDLGSLFPAMRQLIDLLPPDAGAELQRELVGAFRRAGTTAQKVENVLAALGTQVAIALSLEKGPVPKPELLLRVAVRDAERLAPMLSHVEEAVAQQGLEWKTRELDAHRIRYVQVPFAEANLQLSPCYVLHDGALWLASDTAALVRMLRQTEGELAQAADMQQLRVHAAKASGVVHVRSARAVELGWRSLAGLLSAQLNERRDELGVGSEIVPDGEQVAAALATTTMTWRVDERGVTVANHGPLRLGTLWTGLAALVDDVLQRASGRVF
jgi:hypothetical protein